MISDKKSSRKTAKLSGSKIKMSFRTEDQISDQAKLILGFDDNEENVQ
ncbi:MULTISPECIES: hypothetical protein [unclassified Mycoplasma]|nr:MULTISPECIES: hypothetical protein [unclassified Mycoplasma]UUM19874.1 hypothetical protein NPA11_00325 [Mycoplasma sp. 1578d]UUM24858.1 hypothetical protein NPA12_00325 [Mycoplasma sp. 3686d]